MAKEKRPSIYTDRGTIGSSDELDEYGVWVKSDPQDMPLTGVESDELPAAGMDFDIPDMDNLPDFDTLQAEVSKNTVLNSALNDAIDDFDVPVMDSAGEEESSSDVFNFGDFTEQIDISETPDTPDFPDIDDDGIISISEDGPDIDGTSGGIFGGDANETSGGDAGESIPEISMDDFSDTVEIGETDITDLSGIGIDSVPDLSAFEPPREDAQKEQTQDLSTQLLMKIAEELSSIRTELTSLKKEFSGIKVAAEGGEKGGRGEEEDEKISLTGDELNNILNTADFTEEAGEDDSSIDLSLDDIDSIEIPLETDSGFETPEDLEPKDLDMEINLGNTNLELLEGETRLGNSADMIDIDLLNDTGIPEELVPELRDEEDEALSEIREKGVEPMASALDPADADYLTEDPLAENLNEDILDDVFDIEEISDDSIGDSIDLSAAVIDEPDLSSGIQDIPVEEPFLEDISINLDFTELESAEPGSVEQDSTEQDFGELEVLGMDEVSALDAAEEDSAPLEFLELESAEQDSETGSEPGGDISLIPEGYAEELSLEETDESGESPLEEILPEETLEELAAEELTLEEVALDDSESLFEEIQEETEPLFGRADDDEITELTDEVEELFSEESPEKSGAEESPAAKDSLELPGHLKQELKTVLSYMDRLLEALPDNKIEEFARSEYYDTYKKLFKDLGLA